MYYRPICPCRLLYRSRHAWVEIVKFSCPTCIMWRSVESDRVGICQDVLCQKTTELTIELYRASETFDETIAFNVLTKHTNVADKQTMCSNHCCVHLPSLFSTKGACLNNKSNDDSQDDKTSDTAHYCPECRPVVSCWQTSVISGITM